MGALAANRNTEVKDGKIVAFPVYTATYIYKGSIVAVNVSGYLIPAADAANIKVVGVAEEEVNNTGASAALSCRVRTGCSAKLAATSLVQANVGHRVFVVDDQTVDETSTNMIMAGVVAEIVSATVCWVRINGLHGEPLAGFVTLTGSVVVTLDQILNEACLAIATDAKVITLPAVTGQMKGKKITVLNSGADGNNIVTITPNSADGIGGFQLTRVDDKDLVNTKATAKLGDFVVLLCDGSTGWWIVGLSGIWAKEA